MLIIAPWFARSDFYSPLPSHTEESEDAPNTEELEELPPRLSSCFALLRTFRSARRGKKRQNYYHPRFAANKTIYPSPAPGKHSRKGDNSDAKIPTPPQTNNVSDVSSAVNLRILLLHTHRSIRRRTVSSSLCSSSFLLLRLYTPWFSLLCTNTPVPAEQKTTKPPQKPLVGQDYSHNHGGAQPAKNSHKKNMLRAVASASQIE